MPKKEKAEEKTKEGEKTSEEQKGKLAYKLIGKSITASKHIVDSPITSWIIISYSKEGKKGKEEEER